MIKFITEHYDEVLQILGAVVALATLIVKLTPTQKTTRFWPKLLTFWLRSLCAILTGPLSARARPKKKRANRGRRAIKEKGRKKEKIGCLAKKQHAFEKKRFPTFL